ncbi:MAG: hypothetical protein GY758_20225 [Fuerstiella sp.]|nr:hypothetical protein [Fuerstiella sp.]
MNKEPYEKTNQLSVLPCFNHDYGLCTVKKGTTATHANVAYGTHKRNVMDLWLAPSGKPPASVVNVHDGWFTGGDTRNLSLGNVKFNVAAANTTVDGVTNKTREDVYAGEHNQKLHTVQKEA